MARSRSIGTNTEKQETKSTGTQTNHENLNTTYMVDEKTRISRPKMRDEANKSYNLSKEDETMDHSQNLEETPSPQPMTSKQARARSASTKSISAKKRNQNESEMSQKRSAHISSDQNNQHHEDLRFHFSDLSDQSSLNITRVAEQIDHLSVSTPKVAKNKMITKDYQDISMETSGEINTSRRPVLRRSERLRLKRLNMMNENEHEPFYRVNLKHVTMRKNNSRYEEQQKRIKKYRRNRQMA